MYAYTETSYRAVNIDTPLAAGERLADDVPQATIRNIRAREVREQIGAALRNSQWAIAEDSTMDQTESIAWRSYRSALRSLPDHPDFPDMPWPELPRTSGVGSETGEQS
jgi:hypothetical protein